MRTAQDNILLLLWEPERHLKQPIPGMKTTPKNPHPQHDLNPKKLKSLDTFTATMPQKYPETPRILRAELVGVEVAGDDPDLARKLLI